MSGIMLQVIRERWNRAFWLVCQLAWQTFIASTTMVDGMSTASLGWFAYRQPSSRPPPFSITKGKKMNNINKKQKTTTFFKNIGRKLNMKDWNWSAISVFAGSVVIALTIWGASWNLSADMENIKNGNEKNAENFINFRNDYKDDFKELVTKIENIQTKQNQLRTDFVRVETKMDAYKESHEKEHEILAKR